MILKGLQAVIDDNEVTRIEGRGWYIDVVDMSEMADCVEVFELFEVPEFGGEPQLIESFVSLTSALVATQELT